MTNSIQNPQASSAALSWVNPLPFVKSAGSALSGICSKCIRYPLEKTGILVGKIDIYEVIKKGDLKSVKKYVQLHPDAIDPQKFQEGSSILHFAVYFQKEQIIAYLTECFFNRGLDMKLKDPAGANLLLYAVESYDDSEASLAFISRIIKAGGDLNIVTKHGRLSPLHFAAAYGKTRLAHLLIEKGAKIDAQDASAETPLMKAIEYSRIEMVTLLLNTNKCNLLLMNCNHQNALHLSLLQNSSNAYDISAKLLQSSSCPIHKTLLPVEWTPLHIAVARGCTDNFLRKIIDRGAVLNQKDILGRTPLHLALQYNNAALADVLIRAGARFDESDHEGYTPFKQAAKIGLIHQAADFANKEAKLNRNPWQDVEVLERNGDGKFIQEKELPKVFQYRMDGRNTDLYEKASHRSLRLRAICVMAAASFHLIFSTVVKMGYIVFEITKIAMNAIQNFISLCKECDLITALEAITIRPLWVSSSFLMQQILRIAKVPMYNLGIILMSFYTQFNPLEGQKAMNKIADHGDQQQLLRFCNIAKVGNLNESTISNIAQYSLKYWGNS